MSTNKPIPKSQREISEGTRKPLLNQGGIPTNDSKRRYNQKSVKNDDVKNFSIGLRDIDEAIFFYFDNVIKPSVIRNGTKVNVPILYGSPERWKSVQKDGFYRDRNGKILTPLILLKRDSLEKNRQLGNKLDANNPVNFGIFEKRYSNKNIYDRFSVLSNREEVKEYQGVVIPDYVNLTYSCIMFTSYVEQMNKLVESINYASDSYWGDPNKFNFRAMIDSYATTTEMAQGQDRIVKTTFQLSLLGHIVPDSINATLQGSRKFYSKGKVSFGLETVEDTATVKRNRYTESRKTSTQSRFYDRANPTLQNINIQEAMTAEQKTYISLNNAFTSNNTTVTVAGDVVTFEDLSFPTVPNGFPAIEKDDFTFFVNGIAVEIEAITSIVDDGSNVIVTFNDNLNYNIDSDDEFMITGKIIS